MIAGGHLRRVATGRQLCPCGLSRKPDQRPVKESDNLPGNSTADMHLGHDGAAQLRCTSVHNQAVYQAVIFHCIRRPTRTHRRDFNSRHISSGTKGVDWFKSARLHLHMEFTQIGGRQLANGFKIVISNGLYCCRDNILGQVIVPCPKTVL